MNTFSTMKTYAPGDFSFMSRESERAMLKDAYNAISRVEGGWAYLTKPDIFKKDTGLLSSHDPIITKISEEIDKENKIEHNGNSYRWTIQQMECIAKMGWDTYIQKLLHPHQSNFPYPCACRAAKGLTGWCGVAGGGVPACDH